MKSVGPKLRFRFGEKATPAERICNGNLPSSKRTVYQWFDTSCFTQAPLNTYGNAGVFYLDTDGTKNEDLGVSKNFAGEKSGGKQSTIFGGAITKAVYGRRDECIWITDSAMSVLFTFCNDGGGPDVLPAPCFRREVAPSAVFKPAFIDFQGFDLVLKSRGRHSKLRRSS
jgi:hypothetical protein